MDPDNIGLQIFCPEIGFVMFFLVVDSRHCGLIAIHYSYKSVLSHAIQWLNIFYQFEHGPSSSSWLEAVTTSHPQYVEFLFSSRYCSILIFLMKDGWGGETVKHGRQLEMGRGVLECEPKVRVKWM